MSLKVVYSSASEFVSEYVENLAAGGLFVSGHTNLDMLREVDVELVAAGMPSLEIRARPVYVVRSPDRTARSPGAGRIGTGMEITAKPFGFDDALRAHLIKLGKRREVAVMVGDVPGASKLGDAGFKLIPLEPLEAVGFALSDALVQIIAVVVRPNMREAYSMVTRDHGKLVAVYAPARESDVDDIIRNIDKLLVE